MTFLDAIFSPFGFAMLVTIVLVAVYLAKADEKCSRYTPNPDLDVLNSFENYVAKYRVNRMASRMDKNTIELYKLILHNDGVDLDGNDRIVRKRGHFIFAIHNNKGLTNLEFAKIVKEKYDVKDSVNDLPGNKAS